MRDMRIEDYIGDKKILTTAKVKRLDPGTPVLFHSFDSRGEHQQAEYTVIRSGSRKVLKKFIPWSDEVIIRTIVTPREGLECYTEV